MGNQQSVEKGSDLQKEKDKKKAAHRASVHTVSHGKSTAADPTASTANATAQTVPQHDQKQTIQQTLQAAKSPEVPSKIAAGVARSSSRDSTKTEPADTAPVRLDGTTLPASSPAMPMNVPSLSKGKTGEPHKDDPHENDPHFHRPSIPVSAMRPPRLPLPIVDAPIPESPTLPPVQTGNDDIDFDDDEPTEPQGLILDRKNSVLSSATQDEEEVAEELQPYAVDPSVNKAVPVKIDWNYSGEKVYVTGTFANWDRKYRLHRSKSRSDVLSTTVQLPPGTHHVKFIVDGEMKTSNLLPTAVDFTNVLVNYIEVSAEDVLNKPRRPSDRVSKATAEAIHPPLYPPYEEESDGDTTAEEEREPAEPLEEELPLGDFRQLTPQALIDMDLPEDDPKYRQAINVIENGQGPPALPLFLGRSILNGLLPMKDDSSVLALPNHTVLNHLATSSIKNGVLATSVTTRYKKKYVTTIMYKPTGGVEVKS